jgi:hypothetical protein
MKKTAQKVAVAGTNANGEADLVVVTVDVTPEDYNLGKHYDLAEAKAVELGYDAPFVCFDETEQANIHRVYDELVK